MQPLKTLRLLWTFYKSFLAVSLCITACGLGIFWKYGHSVFVGVLWLKMATLALTFYFINSYKNKEYYYYLNLGISKPLLWSIPILFDVALFIVLLVQINKFR